MSKDKECFNDPIPKPRNPVTPKPRNPGRSMMKKNTLLHVGVTCVPLRVCMSLFALVRMFFPFARHSILKNFGSDFFRPWVDGVLWGEGVPEDCAGVRQHIFLKYNTDIISFHLIPISYLQIWCQQMPKKYLQSSVAIGIFWHPCLHVLINLFLSSTFSAKIIGFPLG